MTKQLATLALASATVLGMAMSAHAQTQKGRVDNPELNRTIGTPANPTAPSGGGTTGQGGGANPQINDQTGNSGNAPPPAGGEGRVNSKTQE